LRDYAVVAGIVARRLHLHLMTALEKGTTSPGGFHEPTSMSRCWQEVTGMWSGRLALVPITTSTSKRPLSSKRWS
jgi:hypothetical protein